RKEQLNGQGYKRECNKKQFDPKPKITHDWHHRARSDRAVAKSLCDPQIDEGKKSQGQPGTKGNGHGNDQSGAAHCCSWSVKTSPVHLPLRNNEKDCYCPKGQLNPWPTYERASFVPIRLRQLTFKEAMKRCKFVPAAPSPTTVLPGSWSRRTGTFSTT